MRRPLVWVGFIFIAGELLAAYGGIYSLILAIGMLHFLTARHDQIKKMIFFRCVLAVFLFLGYYRFQSEKEKILVIDQIALHTEVQLSGQVQMVKSTEQGCFCELEEATVWNDDFHIYAGVGVYIPAQDIEPGDHLTLKGEFLEMETAANPGGFDRKSYYQAKGIYILLSAKTYAVDHKKALIWKLYHKIKAESAKIFNTYLHEADRGTVQAMVTGDKTYMTAEKKNLYQESGMMHLFAISGVHISMIGMGIYRLASWSGAMPGLSAMLSVMITGIYMFISGGSASAVRAFVMFMMRMGAVVFGMNYDMFTGLAVSAVIILWRLPFMLWRPEFQMSFMAVFSLVVIMPVLNKQESQHIWIEKIKPMVAIQCVMMPLTAYYYGTISVGGMWLNLIFMTGMEVVLLLAFVLLFLGFIGLDIAGVAGGSLHGIFLLTENLCRFVQQIPLAVLHTGRMPLWSLILYSMGVSVFIYLYATDRKIKMQRLLMTFFLMMLWIPWRKLSPVIVFMDVGQGDGIFIRDKKGYTWLIDGGSTSEKNLYLYTVLPLMQYYGEEKIDYALVSHGDYDHYSAVEELIVNGQLEHLVLTTSYVHDEALVALEKLAKSFHVEILCVKEGDRLGDRNWQFQCLYPPKDLIQDSQNDMSMVLELDVEDFTFLFTGDISENVETWLVNADCLSEYDVLKVAHHGSATSSSSVFLGEIHAKWAVISCAENNRYHHPSKDTIARLEQAKLEILQTKDVGAIIWEKSVWHKKWECFTWKGNH